MTHRAMEPENAEQCRVCMSSWAAGTKTNWRNIFTDSHAGQGVFFIIEEVTGQELKPDKNLPESICPSCLTSAETAFNFKQRLHRSLQLLEQNRTSQEELLPVPPESAKNEFESLTEDDSADSMILEWTRQSTQTEKRRFGCTHCSKTFTKSGNLKAHLRIHTGEHPFKCPQCSKTFSQKGNLKSHLRTHTGERPFECSHCLKTFTNNICLKRHLRAHTAERLFECSQCSETFNEKNDLKKHLRTHVVKPVFTCSHCSKTFAEKYRLTEHLCMHTGEQPVKCTLCSETFTDGSSLLYHLRTHH